MLSVDEPITLITKDGDRITTTAKFKNLCSLVANILQDSDQSEEIPLTQIPTAHLNRILEYSEHHNFIAPEPVEKPLKTGKLDQIISDP